MSRLDDLIKELCPDGVEYKQLEEVLKIKNGSDYKAFSSGHIPVYGSGGIMTYIDHFVYDKPSVLIPRKGSIEKLYYVDTPFWNVDTIFYTEIDTHKVLPRYVYHCLLRAHLEQYNTAGGVPSLTQKVLNKVSIPVPPLPVQQEIVRILDSFTELTAELTAELEARKKQFKYYSTRLFENAKDTRLTTLEEISDNCDYMRKPVTSGKREGGSIPYYGASGVVDYVKDYIFNGDYLLISEDGANLIARSTPIAFSITGKTWVNNHAHVLKFKSMATQKYIERYLNLLDLTPFITGAAQPKLNQKNLNLIQIPLPSMEEQTRIMRILDEFDTISNDITNGLPAEIAARQKQYEYYRDKLLTFKQKEV